MWSVACLCYWRVESTLFQTPVMRNDWPQDIDVICKNSIPNQSASGAKRDSAISGSDPLYLLELFHMNLSLLLLPDFFFPPDWLAHDGFTR